MKRILLLTNEANLQQGGMELANKYLIEILKEKHSLKIVNQKFFAESNQYSKIAIDWEIDFMKLGFLRGLVRLKKTLVGLNDENFDYVIISATPFSSLLYFFLIKLFNFFPSSKVIHFCHNDPFSLIFQASRIPFILYPLGFFLYRQFDLIIATNPYMEETFKKYYFVNKSKIKIIPLPLRPDFSQLTKEKILFDFSRPVIITVTRLTTIQKDPITLLKAFLIVKEKFPQATLLFLGIGPDKEKLIKLTEELGIKKDVHFLGFKKNPLAYVKKSDVFVLSSKSEGTPVVLIEAQACGVPIVATDCPVGPRWVLQDGKAGVLVKIGDERAMADGIINLLKKKKEAEKKVKLGLKFNRLFNFINFKNQWLTLLEK